MHGGLRSSPKLGGLGAVLQYAPLGKFGVLNASKQQLLSIILTKVCTQKHYCS